MNAVELLRNRAGAVHAMTRGMGEDIRGLDLTEPVAPGTSPLGLTLWHLPRTQDWAVQAVIRGVPELAETFGRGLPDPEAWGFGVDLTPERAKALAAEVDVDAVLDYADAVHAEIDGWLAGLSESDLDAVPDWEPCVRRRPLYGSPGYRAETDDLRGKPVGVLLARPVTSHLIHHLGEMGVLAQIARDR